ncbi:hypothetical protein A2769_02740 [Candidatus Daviesbacteria bacterium RIFCSPHIGHO2_01_FULL_37_27]|nr:MAG: hypothetical protein A2769_02740 [Candidatus Daviesbacteria bacterium RIFCSPHIGHO2_01_FULL_37_27]
MVITAQTEHMYSHIIALDQMPILMTTIVTVHLLIVMVMAIIAQVIPVDLIHPDGIPRLGMTMITHMDILYMMMMIIK